MANLDDDINSGVIAERLRAPAADLPLFVLIVDEDELAVRALASKRRDGI